MSQSLVPLDRTKLTEMWNHMSASRKIGLGVLVVAALAGLAFFITWAQTPEYVAAFTDLKTEDEAAIVEYLKEHNIPYQIAEDGRAILVPSGQVHEVRLALAGEGLPGKGVVGFELFDNASLGMTDFTQQVNYQRALEGELARTIASLTAVRSARVHIVVPQPTLFSDEEKPATASVVLELESGYQLNREQVRAISHLVSSAVEGLTPENLTVVDMDGNILADGTSSAGTASVALSATQLEAQRSLERDLELRVESMLENVLGPDKAVVRVSADLNWDQVETESETYLPGDQGSVVRSSRQVNEGYSGNGTTPAGIPGVDSNISSPATSYQTEITGTNGSGYQRSDITTNYEVSRSVSHVIPARGKIERLSVSVLVDNITDTVTLEAIQNATIAAAGVDETRGDVLTVKSVPFDHSFYSQQEVAMQAAQQRAFYLKLAQWGAVAIALLALFLAVRRMQRSLRARSVKLIEEVDPRVALLQEVSRLTEERSKQGEQSSELKAIGPPTFDIRQQVAAEKAQMLRQVQLVAKNRPETLAQIIQFWLTHEEASKL